MMEKLFRLDGKTALITGASGGLGAHFARVCAAAGANIVLAARRHDKIIALAENITAETGQKAIAIQTDVRDEAALRNLFAEAQRQLATPTVIINNAGISHHGYSHQLSETQWQETIDVNLNAVWRVAKIAAKTLIAAKKGGAIINISSILASRTGLMLSAYATSKAGVEHLTHVLALELARDNIRVNALAPGYIPTDLNRDFLESDAGQKMMRRIPFQRFGTVDDLTAPLLLLAADGGRYITGEIVHVDGGHCHSPL